MLEFSKPILKTGAIVAESGLPRDVLKRLALIPGQDYAFRLPGGRDWYWYTEKLSKYLDRMQKAEANKRVRKVI